MCLVMMTPWLTPGDTGSSGSEGNLEDEALADQPEGDNTHAMIGADESESETRAVNRR